MPKYFDFHSHPQASQYDADREEMIKRLKDTETHTIAIGTDLESSKKAVELADKHPEIYASIGLHPVDDPSKSFEVLKFESLVNHPKVVAIGECGLDFFHADKNIDYARQEKLFLAQIDFALNHNKFLMIHARNAEKEVVELLEQLGGSTSKLRGNVHFFAGTLETAKRFFAIGFTLSFTGVITFTSDYDDVIKNAPISLIMAETDAPYVAPTPHRGKRNEPSYVQEVVKRIAEIRKEDLRSVREALVQNALNMIR